MGEKHVHQLGARAALSCSGDCKLPEEPVEIQVFEPVPDKPGYQQWSHNRTLAEVLGELNARLLARDLEPDEYGFDIMPRAEGFERSRDLSWPDYRWIACFAVTGSNEGHYIHIEAIKDNRRELIYVAKTFQGMGRAFEIARACAEILGA